MTDIEIQFEEYVDCLLTMELAVKLAQIDADQSIKPSAIAGR